MRWLIWSPERTCEPGYPQDWLGRFEPGGSDGFQPSAICALAMADVLHRMDERGNFLRFEDQALGFWTMNKQNERKRKHKFQLFMQQKGMCFYCNRPMLYAHGDVWQAHRPNSCTVEHIIPTSKGGSHSRLLNGVAACKDCNNRRGDSDARLFMMRCEKRA